MELPSRVASILLFFHAKLGIDIIQNMIHLLYTYLYIYMIYVYIYIYIYLYTVYSVYIFFCFFLAAPVVMNCQEISVLLIRQVETGRFTIGSVGAFRNPPALE